MMEGANVTNIEHAGQEARSGHVKQIGARNLLQSIPLTHAEQ